MFKYRQLFTITFYAFGCRTTPQLIFYTRQHLDNIPASLKENTPVKGIWLESFPGYSQALFLEPGGNKLGGKE